jgi:MFS family permease
VIHALVILSAAVTIAGDLLYIAYALRGHGEPEAVSWVVWAAVIGVTAGAAVVAGNLGDAAYLSACAAGCFAIGLLTVRAGVAWHWQDAACLAFAGAALGLLTVVHSPQGAAGVTMVADFTGYLPTVATAWKFPRKEILLSWVLWGCGALAGASATGWPTSAAAAWPWYLLTTESAMAVMLACRRVALASLPAVRRFGPRQYSVPLARRGPALTHRKHGRPTPGRHRRRTGEDRLARLLARR